jgi:TldD protein
VTPDLLQELMAKADGRCAYAEARQVHTRSEQASVLNGDVEEVTAGESEGIGVRVRSGGGWGFAATRDVSAAGAEAALARALAIAEAQPAAATTPLAAAGDPARGHWEGPCEQDPFAVSLDERLAHLFAAEEPLRGDERIARTWAGCMALRTTKAFASTEGAACTQVLTECGGGIQAVAVGEGELQVRSYPSSHGGHVAAAGWEHLLALDLAAHAPRVAEEAVALLNAPVCPAEVTTLVIHSEQVALQVHESIGHALELDRILLGEASYAGTSFVTPADLGSLRYGSDLLNVTADATSPGGLGSFGWDDEGVAARRTPLIEAGILRAALSNRESAAAVGLQTSGGCARANGFARQPIVRMTNVNLEPGDAGSLADLIAATDHGLYVENNRSWSIDDRRLQFQFACEVGREIRGGELGRLLRNPSYAGITPRFWGALDAVCSPAEWELYGLVNCGKGEPGQVMHVSHGAAPARFRDVQVGVA